MGQQLYVNNIRPRMKLVNETDNDLWWQYTFKKMQLIFFSKTDYFGDIWNTILKYQEKGNMLISRDVNAKTGSQGKLQNRFYSHLQHLSEAEISSVELNRWSYDHKTNFSRKIWDNHNLRIPNGQTPGDRVDNYNCYNYEGASVPDNPLVEETIN